MPIGDISVGRSRRFTNLGLPEADICSPTWQLTSSVIVTGNERRGDGNPLTGDLTQTAWQLSESAINHFKDALTLLAESGYSRAEFATAKAEVLLDLSQASLFQAMLSSRLSLAKERRDPSLATAEMYAAGSARAVGWSSGSKGTDLRTKEQDEGQLSWKSSELGTKATLTTVRIVWHRDIGWVDRRWSGDLSQSLGVTTTEVLEILSELAKRVGEGGEVARSFTEAIRKKEISLGVDEKDFWEKALGVAGLEYS